MNNKFGAILFIIFLVIGCVIVEIEQHDAGKLLDEHGVVVPAKIIHSSYARGWNIEFEYYYKGIKYTNTDNITAFNCKIGDTLNIKILPENPDGFFSFSVLENKSSKHH